MINRPGSASRTAPVMRSSHAVPAPASGGIVQLEFSLPRSHIHTAGWPARAEAAAALPGVLRLDRALIRKETVARFGRDRMTDDYLGAYSRVLAGVR